METSPVAHKLSERFVAGDSLQTAVEASRRVNNDGISVTLDYLGENVHSLDEALISRDVYLQALDQIASNNLNANVSLKLTQFGMDLSEDACRQNVRELVCAAARHRNFARIDMESSEYTDRTLRLVIDLYDETKSCGAVIQAYLFRSEADITMLCNRGIRVRLCKGAYLEPADVAFQKKADVDASFVRLMRRLLRDGTYPAIATHDDRMIQATLAFVEANGIPHDRFEFQMLYGIRRDLQKRLIAEGYRLRLYVPFGEAWYPYFMRRLAERPANVVFLAKNLFRE